MKNALIIFLVCVAQYSLGQSLAQEIFPILKSCASASNPNECTQNQLYQTISEHLKYPKEAYENDIEGIVQISFIITQEGKIASLKMENCLKYGTCELDYIKKVFDQLEWQNGSKDGQPASFQVLNYPIFLDLAPVNHTPPILNFAYARQKIEIIKIGSSPKKQQKTTTEKTSTVTPPLPQEDITIYTEVDKNPVFFGCENGGPFRDTLKSNDCSQMVLNAFIQKKLIYPREDFSEGIEGVVQLTYIVEKDGTFSNFSIQKGISPACNQAAINVLKAMNEPKYKWHPAQRQGKSVRSQQMIRIRFSITEEKARRAKNGE